MQILRTPGSDAYVSAAAKNRVVKFCTQPYQMLVLNEKPPNGHIVKVR